MQAEVEQQQKYNNDQYSVNQHQQPQAGYQLLLFDRFFQQDKSQQPHTQGNDQLTYTTHHGHGDGSQPVTFFHIQDPAQVFAHPVGRTNRKGYAGEYSPESFEKSYRLNWFNGQLPFEGFNGPVDDHEEEYTKYIQ